MLFRTVYGPELESIYTFITQANPSPPRRIIQQAFLSTHRDTESTSTQGIDDALAFLLATQLVRDDDGFRTTEPPDHLPFRLLVLRQLQRLSRHELEASHAVDPLYILILAELFIKPDRLFVADVHGEANKLLPVKEVGGLSKEKLQAWKRVMSYLGIGKRVGNGFQCAYEPSLLLDALDLWPDRVGPLQEFLEGHLTSFLPVVTRDGNLAQAVSQSLLRLAKQGEITLVSRQDSPVKPYFGDNRFRYVARSKHDNIRY